ncbi:MAG: TonB-dependent receptor [Alcanivoracaceae bacterium]|nr:TonB-dependent receptor [Alcanivoracaceae bacterium]
MKYIIFALLCGCCNITAYAKDEDYDVVEIDTMTVDSKKLFTDTTKVNSATYISKEDMGKMNVTTIEDAISYEPSLIVRKRFIGDPNGSLGIRGSNMFQSTRSMVFADGLPIHYHLQTRWNGAPRWSLIAPNEVEVIEVLYGPFSAEYSGNSMGGVVNIDTAIPNKKKITLEANLFNQDYSLHATDENLLGGKIYASYEDRQDNLSYLFSFNHLENESQPMTQYFTTSSGDSGTEVIGAFSGIDNLSRDGIYYGDSGSEESTTDLLKAKFTYDFDQIRLRTTIAYEDRNREELSPNNFLRDASGTTFWNGNADINGDVFSIRGSNFQNRKQDRESLLIGVGLSGPLANTGNWNFDLNTSFFDLIKDEEVRTARNPDDPDFISQNENFRGRFTKFGNTGWKSLDFKLGSDSFLNNPNMRLSIGYHYDEFKLIVNPFNHNSITGENGSARDASGGKTNTQALFAQWGLAFNDRWDVSFGLRYEDWESSNGFFGNLQHDDRSENATSPKFSLAFFPTEDWIIRYSVARAVRFPIVDELFQDENSADAVSLSDASLDPEDGIHHNLSFEKAISGGYIRLNLFNEKIDDVIFNQRGVVNGILLTTFLPIEEMTTDGIEFIVNQKNVMGTKLNAKLNISYIDAEVTKNSVNPDVVGNQFPRMPKWRTNLFLSYPVSSSVDLSGGVRVASNSFGRLDNTDRATDVFGAHDNYTFINLKAKWQVTNTISYAIGIDNLTDELAYVHHPWPSRTVFLEAKYSFF